MKRSFLSLELLLILIIIAILYASFIPKNYNVKLDEATNRLLIYLNFLRQQALIDDKYDDSSPTWHKKRWTLKFFRCSKKIGGIYYVIYSEENDTGHPGKNEALKDPLTNKYIYSKNTCKENIENSNFVLLKNYDIVDINITCNSTSSLGQISFGNDGRVYSKLSSFESEAYAYEITKPCTIKLVSSNGDFRELLIYPQTSFVKLLEKTR